MLEHKRKSSSTVAVGVAALLCVLTTALTGCSSSKAGSATTRPNEERQDPQALAERLALASATGREIHRRDMIAWWATDIAMPLLGPEDLERMRGWLFDVDEPSTVHFLVEIDGALFTRMLVRCDGSGPEGCNAELLSSPAPLSDRNRAQHLAIATAADHREFVATSDRYNHVVLPAGDSGWWVYLIAATVDPNLMMFGRHYRFLVSPDGTQVLEWRAFTESALVVERAQLPPDATLTAVAVSHLLDDVPTEMHVWAALNYHTPVAVVTGPDTMWMIDDTGAIARIEAAE